MTRSEEAAVTAGATAAEDGAFVALDVGGGGTRVAAQAGGGQELARFTTAEHPASRVAADPAGAFEDLATALSKRIGRPHIRGVAAGIAGVSTHAEDPALLQNRLAAAFDADRSAAVGDEVTAHLGCLSGRPGAVLAAGTGSIALGTDLDSIWRRADGWGHLLGDLGSGAWIGMEALRAAAAALDGRRAAETGLAAAAVRRFGQLHSWPAQFYPAVDRARILASFVTEAAEVAQDGDAVARRIFSHAAGHLAETVAGVLGDGVPGRVGLTGRLFDVPKELLSDPVVAQLRQRFPGLTVTEAEGAPLDGAMLLARDSPPDVRESIITAFSAGSGPTSRHG